MKYWYSDIFADYVTSHTHSKYLEIIKEKSQRDADRIKDWNWSTKMHINYDKTNYMSLGTMHKLNNPHQFDLRIDNKRTKNTQNQKLLGIYIDDKLCKWNCLLSETGNFTCYRESTTIEQSRPTFL